MNIRENVSLASFWKIFGKLFIKRGAERQYVETLSGQLNIKAPTIETNVLTLSGGNQQKVVLAKWLMTDVRDPVPATSRPGASTWGPRSKSTT